MNKPSVLIFTARSEIARPLARVYALGYRVILATRNANRFAADGSDPRLRCAQDLEVQEFDVGEPHVFLDNLDELPELAVSVAEPIRRRSLANREFLATDLIFRFVPAALTTGAYDVTHAIGTGANNWRPRE